MKLDHVYMNIKSGELVLYKWTQFFTVLETEHGYLIHWDEEEYVEIGVF